MITRRALLAATLGWAIETATPHGKASGLPFDARLGELELANNHDHA
jgi:hypothetical protein